MSEHFPIAPNKNDKNVLVPFSDGRIEVMQLSDQVDESGRQIAYKLEEDGMSVITRAGVPEAYGEEVQAYYAHKLAMDRNPTPEQMERGAPPKVITDLGDVALESTVVAPISAEASNILSSERESSQDIELNFKLVADEVSALKRANENFRQLPEAEGRRNLDAYIIKKAHVAYDGFKAGKVNQESYSVLANALLGAASSHESIGMIVDNLRDAKTLDADEMSDLSSQAGAIGEIASLRGLEGERARISFANSLIARSERLLEDNGQVANDRYRAIVGFIAGLSSQIKDPSTSSGFVSGSLAQLKKYS